MVSTLLHVRPDFLLPDLLPQDRAAAGPSGHIVAQQPHSGLLFICEVWAGGEGSLFPLKSTTPL